MPVRQAIARAALLTAGIGASVLISSVAPAHADPSLPTAPDQISAENAIMTGYIDKQIQCTPDMPPDPLFISWDPPGFTESRGGSGMINDADSRLGGHFSATWDAGVWDVEYEFC